MRFGIFEIFSLCPIQHSQLSDSRWASRSHRRAAERFAPICSFAMSDGEIVVSTAPHDKRFPTTNQTKHCWARYLEFHACTKAKGEDDPECEKFQRWYKSLCPAEWVS